MNLDDGPLPPPASIAGAIPPFHLHRERNCGDHRHGPENPNFTKYLQRQGRRDESAWVLPCSSCHARVTRNQLHDLPCGDMICRDCLAATALTAKHRIERNRSQIRDARALMARIEHRLCERGPGQVPGRDRKTHLRRHAQLQKAVVEWAGLACCGVDMRLDRFLACLGPGPDASRDLWLAIHWLRDPPAAQRACAWPDCGAYLPVCCGYYAGPRGAGGRRYYCVTCQGNSMDCARTLEAPQTRFPFLPKSQDALTPAG